MFEEFAKRALRLAFIAGEPQRATAQQIERGLVRATKRLQPIDDLRGSLRRAAAQECFGERAQHALIVGRKASGDQQQDEAAFRLAVTRIEMAERVQQFHRLVASCRHVAVSSRRRARKRRRCSISSPTTVLASWWNSSLSLSCGRTVVSSRSRIAIARSLDRIWGSATAGLTSSPTSSRRVALPTVPLRSRSAAAISRANSGDSTALSLTGTIAVSPATPC